jgi:leucyl/phenylalanyl-tRNA--protein transferase
MHAPVAPPIPIKLLLQAYRSGVFPMADDREDSEVFWVEPRERAILPLDGFHCSRSLLKVLKQDRFTVTCNAAFGEVIRICAAPRPDQPTSWISRRIEASYNALHAAGHAHSIECWRDGELVGGLYGVAFDKVFCGESMYSHADNASKVALAWLVAAMRRAGYRLLDCQFMTGHLGSLGAVPLPQADYVALLAEARGKPLCSIPQAVAAFQAEGAAGDAAGAGVAAGRGGASSSALSSSAAGASSPGKLIVQSLTQTS